MTRTVAGFAPNGYRNLQKNLRSATGHSEQSLVKFVTQFALRTVGELLAPEEIGGVLPFAQTAISRRAKMKKREGTGLIPVVMAATIVVLFLPLMTPVAGARRSCMVLCLSVATAMVWLMTASGKHRATLPCGECRQFG